LVRGIWLEGQPDRRVEALCYAVDRGHPQYAGRLSHDRQLHIVRQGRGRSGNNRDYVIETANALEALNITDHDLHVLAERLKGSPDARA
jgi:cation transport protein ChaC